MYKRQLSGYGSVLEEFPLSPSPPRAVDLVFVRVMALKTRLRKLRALGIEAHRDRVVVHLRDDAPLDAPRMLELCAPKRSPWKLSPDMRLSRRFDDGLDGVTHAEQTLDALEPLRLDTP